MSRIFALTALPVALAVLVGCGNKVDPDLPVSDMTTEDWTNFCDWSGKQLDSIVGEHDCDGLTITVEEQELDECIAEGELISASSVVEECGLLAGDMEECVNDQADDPCSLFESEACTKYVECLFTGGGGGGGGGGR